MSLDILTYFSRVSYIEWSIEYQHWRGFKKNGCFTCSAIRRVWHAVLHKDTEIATYV